MLKSLALTVLFTLAGVSLYMLALQDKMIFHPVVSDSYLLERYRSHERSFQANGYQLQAWEFDNPNASSPYTLFYFGGNAEDVMHNFPDFSKLGVSKAFYFSYRGYGASEGKPSQKAFYEDALALYDQITGREDIAKESVVVAGRSLGSSVATYLSSQRQVANVILITPFDSIKAVAQAIFPFLPVKWFLRHPFPSDQYAKLNSTNALMMVAEQDEIIGTKHSKALFEIWQGNKTWQTFLGMGHNDIHLHPEFYSTIREFIEKG